MRMCHSRGEIARDSFFHPHLRTQTDLLHTAVVGWFQYVVMSGAVDGEPQDLTRTSMHNVSTRGLEHLVSVHQGLRTPDQTVCPSLAGTFQRFDRVRATEAALEELRRATGDDALGRTKKNRIATAARFSGEHNPVFADVEGLPVWAGWPASGDSSRWCANLQQIALLAQQRARARVIAAVPAMEPKLKNWCALGDPRPREVWA